MGNSSGFNKYIGTPIHGHHKLCDKPGRASAGATRRGVEGFYTMYKVGTMPAAPAGQGGSEGEGSRCPSLRQPSRCPLAQVGRAAPASRPCRDGVPRLGAWPHRPCHAPLCPPPCAGAMGGGDPPTAAWPRCALALLRAVVTAQRLHASALASWTFSRASGGASGAAVEESGAERRA